MSIADQVTRLQDVKSDILSSIESKGVDVPSSSKLSDAPSLIDSISTLDSSVIANPYSVSTPYTKGTLVMNNGHLYNALDDMEAGEWDETKWFRTNVAASIPTKTSELVNDSGFGATNLYSYEDVAVGTWVDGNTLYRRIINTSTTIPSSTWVIIERNSDIKTVINSVAVGFSPDGFAIMNAMILTKVVNSEVSIYSNQATFVSGSQIIVEYTKK